MENVLNNVASNVDRIKKLREEIAQLKQVLLSMDVNKAPNAAKALQVQISASTQEFNKLTAAASKAAAVMENDLKNGIKVVNELTQKIINQKATIKSTESEVLRLSDSYKSVKNNPAKAESALGALNSAKEGLQKENTTLAGLEAEQESATLSVKKLREEYALYKNETGSVANNNESMAQSFGKVFDALGGMKTVKQLGSEIIRVRGEFQQVELSFNAMLGADRGTVLLDDIKKYAATSPVDFSSIAAASEMMIGLGIEAEKVPQYISAIGDVSLGDPEKFNAITLAFSQMSESGKLMEQDLNQMIQAGFNPLSIIAEQTGQSMTQLKANMAAGAISAEMIQQAFKDATSAGGQFFGMTENASNTINGQLSILQNAITLAFNELGENSEGAIMGGIELTTALVENYETVGKVIAGLVTTYGVYRTAVMVATAVDSLKAAGIASLTIQETIHYGWLVALKNAQNALNASMLTNPYVLLTAAIVGVGMAMWAMHDGTTAAERAQERFNETAAYQKKQLDDLKNGANDLISVVKSETSTQYDKIKAYKELQKLLPSVFANMDIETLKLMDILSYNKQIAEEVNRRERVGAKTNAVLRQNELNDINARIDKMKKTPGRGGEYLMRLEEEKKVAEEALKLANKAVEDIVKIQDEANKLKSEKSKIQNKEYWEDQKKSAEKFLADIDSKQKKLLDSGKFNGIDAKVVQNYKSQSKLLKEAQEELKVYDISVDQKEKGNNYIDSYQQSKEIEKASQLIKDAIISSEISIQQQEIDLDEEGYKKQLKQINLNYDKRYQEILKEERNLLQKLQDEERKQWEKDNPKFKEKNLQFTSTITSLAPEQRAQFDDNYSLAYQKKEKDTQALLDKLLEKYRDYDAQIMAIEKQGNEEITYLRSERTDLNSAEIDRSIKVAQDKIKEAIQQINDTKAEAATKSLFGDVSSMSFEALQNLISQAKQLRKYLSNDGDAKGITFISSEQLEAIEKSPSELDKLKKALDKLLGTNKEEKKNKWDSIFEKFEQGFDNLKSSENFREIAGAIGTIGGAASLAAGELANMFDDMGQTEVAGAIKDMQQMMDAVSNIGEGFAKGGPVGGIAAAVGEAAKFIGKAVAANARHKAALKEIMNSAIAQQRAYNLLLLQQNLLYERGTTIFGADAYGKAKNAVENLKESLAALNKELVGTAEQKNGQEKQSSMLSFFGIKDANAALKQAYAGLAEIEIKTGHKKTGVFGWGKGKDTYSSILGVYPELIKANGDFDTSLAETIIKTREMSNEGKAALQNMIDLGKQAEEAYKALNNYMTDIFGDLGNTMSDALVDAFVNGTDAAKAFTDSVSNMLETLAKQMIYSVTLAPVIEKAQNQMMEVMKDTGLSDEQKFSKWVVILDNFVDDSTNQQNKAYSLYDKLQQIAAGKGFDIFSSDQETSQSSTKGGFESMSQDTGDELNGRFTALQIAGEEIKNQNILQTESIALLSTKSEEILFVNNEMRGIADETRTILANSYLELVQISENTGAIVLPIKGMNEKLDKIEQNTRGLV